MSYKWIAEQRVERKYKNLVVLNRNAKKATSEQFHEAPLESDLNTIVKTIMGSDYIPKELDILRKKYRNYFENDKMIEADIYVISKKQ